MVRVITPGDSVNDLPKPLRKWKRLYPTSYVAVCRKGCHGTECEDYNAALNEADLLDKDCLSDAERDSAEAL